MAPRANTSANTSNTPPASADSASKRLCVVLTTDLTSCGADNPTKAISPVWATAVPVARAITAINAARNGPRRKPRLAAVASPKTKPSNTRLHAVAKAVHTAQTTAIKPTDNQPTNPVDPNQNACMPWRMSGDTKVTIDVSAPNTTPTTTPANSRRKLF